MNYGKIFKKINDDTNIICGWAEGLNKISLDHLRVAHISQERAKQGRLQR